MGLPISYNLGFMTPPFLNGYSAGDLRPFIGPPTRPGAHLLEGTAGQWQSERGTDSRGDSAKVGGEFRPGLKAKCLGSCL